MKNHSTTFFNLASHLSGPEQLEGILVLFDTKVTVTKLALRPLRGTREERPRLNDQNPTKPNTGWIYLLGCKNTNTPANGNHISYLDGGVKRREVWDVWGIGVATTRRSPCHGCSGS